jgi:small subunit ribosomal protein S13
MILFRDTKVNVNKEIRVSLRAIYGVGWRKGNYISARAGLSYPFFLSNISSFRSRLVLYLLKCMVISDVRVKRVIELNILKLKSSGSYKGERHRLNLPVRGQRTRTNAWTQKNKREKIEFYKL